MPKTTMTFAAWKRSIGPAVTLGQLPELTQKKPAEIARAIREGLLPIRTFRAATGVSYQRVRIEDVLLFLRGKTASRPKVTMEDMARAFRQMVGEQHLKR
ncbi:hypothetical protein [Mucisphaera calidilacus]|uniref:Helix-turn-helix domain-containing protein n=1 Tax=Mucisphaera calidilacus TaxID=2527982 RepID=A0A518BZV0_9BACT|nr:hypothetical protein [Mucisphaera calidilacus]QDU72479.1 hypothetical protein Pan265_23450 [Mucisphaera calidilacus]